MESPATTGAERAHVWTFFRQWLKNPIAMSAISPSSAKLARQMVAELPDDTRRVIELGAGTGVFTRALIARGIQAENLMVLELNEELHAHLQELFPAVHVQHGDARELVRLAAECGFSQGGPADAVISGLGMLSMPRDVQHDILAAAFECLQPQGRFIQFTYGPATPIAQGVLDSLGINARRGAFVWRNLPPATVFVFTRNRSEHVSSVQVPAQQVRG
jgi:phosphatidylethanolamine/phosphatidyl-N-methylethanolamine N-methyltransferase